MTLLEISGVERGFNGVPVLRGINLRLSRGEVLALAGENGAGKTTLMRIAAGLIPPDTGVVNCNDVALPLGVVHAERAGVVMVHQEFNLAPHLTVGENITLGREPVRGGLIDQAAVERVAREELDSLGATINVASRLRDLPVADWQLVELSKAFARKPRVILMDEPTAVLSAQQAARLFDRIRRFCKEGGACIFTSHRLDEVLQIAGRVAVLRDGQIVRISEAADITEEQIAEAMVGRPLAEIYPRHNARLSEAALLEVTGLDVPGYVSGASLSIRKGEILGVSGLVGAGRTELFEALVGLRPAQCKAFRHRGRQRAIPSAREAWRLGMAYLTEDRKGKGLLLSKPLAWNVSLTRIALERGSWLHAAEEKRDLAAAVRQYDVRLGHIGVNAGALSGGNQQKILIAKTLATNPELVIFDEPTRGVDIGAKKQIYDIIARLAGEGKAVVVISSEMQEIVGLSDRVIVMRQGRICGELTGDTINESEIIRYATGLQEEIAYV